MIYPTAAQHAFDDFARSAGFEKKNGAWYRHGNEVISVLDLQKSQFGRTYYINVAWWLMALGEEKYPKPQRCHIVTRIDSLFPGEQEHLERLLDLESPVEESDRVARLTLLLESRLLPLLDQTASIEGLRSSAGEAVLRTAMSSGPAQVLIRG
jgi:hypothetical protein